MYTTWGGRGNLHIGSSLLPYLAFMPSSVASSFDRYLISFDAVGCVDWDGGRDRDRGCLGTVWLGSGSGLTGSEHWAMVGIPTPIPISTSIPTSSSTSDPDSSIIAHPNPNLSPVLVPFCLPLETPELERDTDTDTGLAT